MPVTLKKSKPLPLTPPPLGTAAGNSGWSRSPSPSPSPSSRSCDATSADGAKAAPFAEVRITGCKLIRPGAMGAGGSGGAGGAVQLNVGGTVVQESTVALAMRIDSIRGQMVDSTIDRLGLMVRMGHIGRCAKQAMGHGEFAGWVKEHNLHERMMRRAMRLAKWFGNPVGELDLGRCRTALNLPKNSDDSKRRISQRQLEALVAVWEGEGGGEQSEGTEAERAAVAAKRTVRVLDRLTLLSAELPPEVASEVDEKLAEIRELVEALAGGGK